MSDKVYTYDDYILSYTYGGENDRSCMTISKILNGNLYVMAELYDGSADVVSIMLDNLQQESQQKENIIKEVREWSKKLKYETLWQTTREELEEILDKENI